MTKKKRIIDYPDKAITEFDMRKKYEDNPSFNGLSNDFDCPKLHKNKFQIILMRDEKSNSGHWVVCMCEDKECLYFDSFGMEPDLVVLKRMREFAGKKCFINDFALQLLSSQRCGIYVQKVIDAWLQGMNFRDIMEYMNEISENKEYD